ncbi:uncharacterized protein C8R40DRAFT_1063573 [Lentinula edodes]|uniref:uncharacterized protein n=1 Tax=Lentinula edodes TaxID=5353 RepID=UPI001E8EDB35|nr:uncharacterized protein C8R40DRAFT_1063573 [Lentinula edodes]KAH7867816.1 hypothetical protein C8R40DRAFT_1063573 [Lentinula edodes]
MKQTEMEQRFSRGLFHGVYENPEKYRKSRAQFQWPEDLGLQERLLVVFNCMSLAGFSCFGAFLFAAFQCKVTFQNPSVSKTIANFLHCPRLDSDEHPLSIIKLIYNHPKSQAFENHAPKMPSFSLPHYALPPSSRNLLTVRICSEQKNNTTRNAILDWAVQRVIEHVDDEAEKLTQLKTVSKGWKEKVNWDSILNWSMSETQETLALTAPVIFFFVTTIAVSRFQRKKLDAKAMGVTCGETEHSLDEEAIDDLPQLPTKGYKKLISKSLRDPWLGSTTVILTLLYLRYRYAAVFPTIMGIFLFSTNTNREVINVVSRLGLSTAYSTILATLHILAADSASVLRNFGAALEYGPPNFLLLFDNVNKNRRAWKQSLLNQDIMSCGTAATLIVLENVLPGALDMAQILRNTASKARSALTIDHLLSDVDWKHLDGIGSATILRIWIKHVSSLSQFHVDVEEIFKSKLAKYRLCTRKTQIHTMRTTNIDESSTVGANDVLRNLVFDQLAISTHWLKCFFIFICGDQLSIDRIRKLILYTYKGETPSNNYKWALPVIQLWHMKYNWQRVIVQCHWWKDTGKTVYGLAHDARHIRREKFNPDKCDFYPAHHLLEDRFTAMVLHALRILCEEKCGIVTAPTVSLLDGLETYFEPGGPMHNYTFEQLVTLSKVVHRRYMVSAAHEDALGHTARPMEVYGPPTAPENSNVGSESYAKNTPNLGKKKKSRRSKAPTAEMRNYSSGDQCLANDISFMRTSLWYLEMCSAIAEGDIGRVFEVIKVLRFSFWGAGSTNYGNELLELACNFLYEFTPELILAIFENYLVNTSNLAGHWFELDLLQEHFNFWIKRLFNSKSHDFDSEHLAECVSLNIRGLSMLRGHMSKQFGLSETSYTHSDPSKIADINRLGSHYRAHNILRYIPARDQPYLVPDEYTAGINYLADGQLDIFLQRTMRGGLLARDELSDGDIDEVEGMPANPITSEAGGLKTSEFIM